MISLTAIYALRAAVCLAESAPVPSTADDIARRTSIPAGYLAKVLQNLARAGIVQSRRGRGGGFTLSRKPAHFTVLEVVNAVDPIQRIRGCPLDLTAHQERLCPLHRRLDDSIAAVEAIFSSTSLLDLLENGGPDQIVSATDGAAVIRNPVAEILAPPPALARPMDSTCTHPAAAAYVSRPSSLKTIGGLL